MTKVLERSHLQILSNTFILMILLGLSIGTAQASSRVSVGFGVNSGYYYSEPYPCYGPGYWWRGNYYCDNSYGYGYGGYSGYGYSSGPSIWIGSSFGDGGYYNRHHRHHHHRHHR